MFARSFCVGSLRGLSRSAAPAPIKQSFRSYASQTQSSAKSLPKNLLYASAVGIGAGLVWHFTLRDSGVGKNVERAKELPPATPAFTGDDQWIDLKLVDIEILTPTTKRLRFALPEVHNVSGLKTASCLLTKFKGPNDAKPTIRPYTPVSDEGTRGYIDILVKRYEGGPMSTHIHSMNTDQGLEFKGPILKYEWVPNKHEHITLIAGGTGITPMYQLVRAIFKNPDDKTKVTLVYGNRNEDEILLRKEFQDLENTYPQRFKAFYLLDKKPEGSNWASEGFVTKELLKTVLPEPRKGNNKIFVCGPPGMYKAISGGKKSPKDQGELTGYLKELGYSAEDVYKF